MWSIPICPRTIMALLMVAAGQGCNVRPADVNANGALLVVSPQVVDFGRTKERNIAQQVIVTNRSNSVLHIVRSETSCGCTVVGLSMPQEVPPGGELIIPFHLKFEARQTGAVSQRVIFHTDEPNFPECHVAIRGTLESDRLTTIPQVLSFGTIGGWQDAVKEIKICPSEGSNCVVESVKASSLQTRFVRKARDGCLVYEVITSKASKPGRLDDTIEILTSEGKTSIAVTGERMGAVFVTPVALSCGNGERECLKEIELVHSTETVPQEISASCDIAEVTATEVLRSCPGRTRIQMRLRFFKTDADTRGTLKIRNSLAAEPLVVDIYFRK